MYFDKNLLDEKKAKSNLEKLIPQYCKISYKLLDMLLSQIIVNFIRPLQKEIRQRDISPLPSDHWQEVQNEVTEFANQTFGDKGAKPPLHHLLEEVKEVIESEDVMEYADCMILLIQAAKKSGYSMNDLFFAVKRKTSINRKRKWGKPDKNGVVSHVSNKRQ